MTAETMTAPTIIPDKIEPMANAGGAGEGGVEGGVEGGMEGGVLGGVLDAGGPANKIVPMGTTQPIKEIKRVNPEYPPAALAMGLEGRVVIELVVNENGDVENARIMQSTNPIFNENALTAVKKWKFSKPTTQGGEAVKTFWTVVLKFQKGR